jgi:hypothetical protein
MLPIGQDFEVCLTAVTAMCAVTLRLCLPGTIAAGWMADRFSVEELSPRQEKDALRPICRRVFR